MRWRLQRRIFLWFGAAILVTGGVVAIVLGLIGSQGWKRDWTAMQSFAGSRFERVWDDPIARNDLARSMHDDLHVDVVVRDAEGRTVEQFGNCAKPHLEIPVDRGPKHLGDVRVCADRHRPPGFGRAAWIALFVALVFLWGASHVIARRLSRPLVEIERVAKDIARGNLSSRVDLQAARGLEAHLLGKTLNEMAERIETQIAEYRSLLAAVSHEIRTPLARMRLLVELSQSKDAKLEELDREIVAVDELVGELLAVSRVDFGALQKRRVSIKDIALRALEDARVDPSVLELQDPDAAADADPTLLVRAVRNLLENAERHGGGVKSFLVKKQDGEISFEVEDEGPGIPEGEQDKIFEPFRKMSNDEKSVGLGLALVRRIAIAHGGRAYAKNLEPKGALVGFALAAA